MLKVYSDSGSRFFCFKSKTMITGLIGRKLKQTQAFLEDGRRVPVSQLSVTSNIITQIKTTDHEGYNSLQLGFGMKKKVTKAEAGHSKKAGIKTTPRFLREIRTDAVESAVGTQINPTEVFKPGDIIDVTGTSKGKGFAGGVKRHHFKGGPRTHGQSDRERAPGSIGQTTTPGRVYKGKRMAGKMGAETRTSKNLVILDVTADQLSIKGLVPGPIGSIVVIKKVGEDKKFVPVLKKKTHEEQSEVVAEEVISSDEIVSTQEEDKEEVKEEVHNA